MTRSVLTVHFGAMDSRRPIRRSGRLAALPPKRERLTPVSRLRRRARPAELEVITGNYGSSVPAAPGDTFRVVSWNIEDGLDVDGGIKGLSEHENLRSADAVCLQEMDPVGVERMAKVLELNYVYSESSRDDRTGRGFGNAVLSPHPLTDCEVMALPHVAKAYGRPRAAVHATVLRPGADRAIPVSVWSIHAEIPSLPLSKRIAQYTAVAARAIRSNPDHLILAGDFNTTTLTSVYAIDDLYGLFDLDRVSEPGGPSLRRAGKLFHLDHIFARGMERVDSSDTGVERSVIASDHWPMWAELTTSSNRSI